MLSPQAESFAAFVTRKRKEHNLTMRALANVLGVSGPYLYDVEQGHRNPLKKENLEKMAAFFELDEEETALMFDLAGIDRGIVPLDLPDYILNNAYGSLRYRTDFEVGDIVTCVDTRWGVRVDARITEMTETYQKGRQEIVATFGDSLPTLMQKIKR